MPHLGLYIHKVPPRTLWHLRSVAATLVNITCRRSPIHRHNCCDTGSVIHCQFSTKNMNYALLKCQKQKMMFPGQSSLLLPAVLHSSTYISYFSTTMNLLSEKDNNGSNKPSVHKKGSSSSSSDKGQENEGKEQNEDDDDQAKRYRQMMEVNLYVGLLFFIIYLMTSGEPAAKKTVSWTSFINEMLSLGEVEYLEVMPDTDAVNIYLHKGAIINGIDYPRGAVYHMEVSSTDAFEQKLRKVEQDLGIKQANYVPIKYTHSSNSSAFITLGFMLVLVGVLIYALRNSMSSTSGPLSALTQLRKAKFTLVSEKKKGITFKDVAGLHEAKQEVREFLDYLKNPTRFTDLGAKVPKGALLLGPPGCGKTLLAKALASESDVPFLYMAGSEFVEVIGGLGAARVRDLFLEARKRAPCIIYIDELDAIGRKRSQGNGGQSGSGEEEQTLNQLLVEMDGMGTQKGVIMIASTNRADVLDPALLRPGRFDRHILIDTPTAAERWEIFNVHLSNLKSVHSTEAYAGKLAAITAGLSGADIANICNEAALYAAREGSAAVDYQHFDYAVEKSIAGTVKKTKILSPEEKSVIAFHEAGHALVGWLLEHTDALLKVSIVPRMSATLGFSHYQRGDKYLVSKEELFQRMCMGLGGRVAEAIVFKRVTSGAEDDLKKITQMAYQQIKELGMNERVGLVSFDLQTPGFGRRPFSKRLANLIDQEAKLLIGRAYTETESLLKSNMELLKTLANVLLKEESLNYDQIQDLIGPPPFGEKRTIDVHEWDSSETSTEDVA